MTSRKRKSFCGLFFIVLHIDLPPCRADKSNHSRPWSSAASCLCLSSTFLLAVFCSLYPCGANISNEDRQQKTFPLVSRPIGAAFSMYFHLLSKRLLHPFRKSSKQPPLHLTFYLPHLIPFSLRSTLELQCLYPVFRQV